MSWGRGTLSCSSTPARAWTARSSCRAPRRWRRDHRLLLVDLPGNGRSPEPEEWTLAAHARALEELVRERGLEDWTLLGHSFGGFVSMQHLVDFPGSASRLIASCTDADEDPAPGAPEGLYDNLPPEVEAAFEREDRVTSDEEAREVWLDQLPFFAPDPGGREAVRAAFADVVYRHEAVLHAAMGRAARAHRARHLRDPDPRDRRRARQGDAARRRAPDRRDGAARRPGDPRRRRALPVRRGARGLLGRRPGLARPHAVAVAARRRTVGGGQDRGRDLAALDRGQPGGAAPDRRRRFARVRNVPGGRRGRAASGR